MRLLTIAMCVVALCCPMLRADTAGDPDNSGPMKLLSCSWLGCEDEARVVSAVFLDDGTFVLAVNGTKLKNAGVAPVSLGEAKPVPADPKTTPAPPDTLLVRLAADGQKILSVSTLANVTPRKLLTAGGRLYLLASAPGGGTLANVDGVGACVLTIDSGLKSVQSCTFIENAGDLAIYPDGTLLVLHGKAMSRVGLDGKTLWTATWPTHGDNRPGAITLSPETQVAAVVGYGMTKTGHEPYKDPFAYGFDRDGKQVWALWNPDPTLEVDAKKYGGNGLMADTTGHTADVGADGTIYLGLFADGGNTVCMRDPHDPNQPLGPQVTEGVFQKGAGFGFHGASKTSVIFRIDSKTGAVQKATWMCAWLTPAHANGLSIEAAAPATSGATLLVGGSADGCPTHSPWYTAPQGGYRGGGFVALVDANFGMVQCGYFDGTSLHCVARHGNRVLVAGSASQANKFPTPKGQPATTTPATYPVPLFHPLTHDFAALKHDGYFALFELP